mmetsp:Transcript_6168/g.6908  ORF Transcript_6168/g.6908 Transcript_6168/m.6908 type:complete len:144 (-) Transcript_6168:52-483(-)
MMDGFQKITKNTHPASVPPFFSPPQMHRQPCHPLYRLILNTSHAMPSMRLLANENSQKRMIRFDSFSIETTKTTTTTTGQLHVVVKKYTKLCCYSIRFVTLASHRRVFLKFRALAFFCPISYQSLYLSHLRQKWRRGSTGNSL